METSLTNNNKSKMPSSSLGGCLGLGGSSPNEDTASSVNSSCNSTTTTATAATNIASVNASAATAAASYYFGNISRETAEQILYDLGAFDGLFLIRDSTATDSVLSLCHQKR